MERDNIIAILGIIKTAYPRFYSNMTKSEAEETIALWQEMFTGTDIKILTMAVKSLISHFEYPPTIADVKKEIAKYTIDTTQNDIMELWNKAREMTGNSTYMTPEQFEEYPEVCKKFFGNLGNLKGYGMMETTEIVNNIQPRFLKFAENYYNRKKEEAMLPAGYNVKQLSE